MLLFSLFPPLFSFDCCIYFVFLFILEFKVYTKSVFYFIMYMSESWLSAYWPWLLVYRLIISFHSLTLWSKLVLEHRRTFVYVYWCIWLEVCMRKNIISFPFMVSGCCLSLVWLVAGCVFLPTVCWTWNGAELSKVWLPLLHFMSLAWRIRMNRTPSPLHPSLRIYSRSPPSSMLVRRPAHYFNKVRLWHLNLFSAVSVVSGWSSCISRSV